MATQRHLIIYGVTGGYCYLFRGVARPGEKIACFDDEKSRREGGGGILRRTGGVGAKDDLAPWGG